MCKTVTISVLLTLVIGLLLLIFFRSRSPFGNSNSTFSSEPQEEITKIELSEGGRKLFLEKEGKNWFINGKVEIRKSGILFILRILQEIKIKSPVSAELFESEITGKGIVPVKVSVFEKRKLIRTFLVYKTKANTYGNIMKINEGSKPFIVYVPGYEGDIGSGFTLNELFWQPYTVFKLLPSEIASVNFENLLDTASSFSIVNNNQHYVISSMTRDMTGWDSTLVTRYLSYFTWIPFESWAFEIGDEEKKVIESQQPMYIITVNTNKGRKIILTLWERMTVENSTKTKDSDRLFGKTQDKDGLFVIRYFDIDPLLKKRSYFFPE
ncbi:MAG: hypothetical protein NT144_12190 [Bacteroidia bacterium]|nr:hypothetical protein [Bacteroidia bacterium]